MAMKVEDAFTQALAASRAYTKETVLGGGAIKGKNCTISNKVAIEGGTRVYFSWTLDDGTEKSDYIDVMNGDTSSIWKIQGKFGAKNLLVYPYYETSKTKYGVTFTINDDSSITVNGTATGSAGQFFLEDNLTLKKGSYILSTTELLPKSVYSQVLNKGTGVAIATIGNNSVQSSLFTLTEDTVVRIRISASVGSTTDNLVIYEMLRYAEDTDDTWQPYAMTNKQLTDALVNDGEVVNNEATVSQELKSNFTYIFSNAVENLTISLPSNRREWEEFNFIFTTSSTGCNLALPSEVTWIGGTPTLDANTYYEVSIKNNKAVIG